MKKIPVTEDANKSGDMKEVSSAEKNVAVDQSDAEDPMAGLQADLDRFRDLAMRTQADFEN